MPPKQSKQRKPQLEEEFLVQKTQFYSQGPTINNDENLFDQVEQLDLSRKPDRNQLIYMVQRCYYMRDFEKCIEYLNLGLSHFDDMSVNSKVDKQLQELLEIKLKCELELAENI